jgi:ribosomal protein S18 acetylase RimI-like enzyme
VEKIVIRELREADADDIVKIFGAIIQKPVHPDFPKLIVHHAQHSQEGCFVAEQNDRVVGFLISYILTLGFGVETSAWIANLGVDPDFMGNGIGGKLAEKTFELYKSKHIIRVYTSVRWDTSDLLSFFKTQGFEQSNFINLKKDL